jgi:metallo-beta-lactamase class B
MGRAMFVRAGCLLLGAIALTSATPPRSVEAKPASWTELLDACAEKDGWRDPAPPVRIDGNVFYVGTCGITSLLVTSPAGHILIDSAEEEAVPQILANIRRLGFDPKHVRWLLASHTHFDHTGGHAAMQAATGAKIAALPNQASELASGKTPDDDPQHGIAKGITPVKVDRVLKDGVPLFLGPIRATAFATPGHTRGSTSWVIRGCGKKDCPAVTYADSASPVSADDYRFTDHPAWVAQFRKGVRRIGTLPCSILVTPHPGSSTLFERFAGDAPLVNRDACKFYSAKSLEWLDSRLAKERGGK